eukprot:13037138-Heterocapsa_arctica.AAC.1
MSGSITPILGSAPSTPSKWFAQFDSAPSSPCKPREPAPPSTTTGNGLTTPGRRDLPQLVRENEPRARGSMAAARALFDDPAALETAISAL